MFLLVGKKDLINYNNQSSLNYYYYPFLFLLSLLFKQVVQEFYLHAVKVFEPSFFLVQCEQEVQLTF